MHRRLCQGQIHQSQKGIYPLAIEHINGYWPVSNRKISVLNLGFWLSREPLSIHLRFWLSSHVWLQENSIEGLNSSKAEILCLQLPTQIVPCHGTFVSEALWPRGQRGRHGAGAARAEAGTMERVDGMNCSFLGRLPLNSPRFFDQKHLAVLYVQSAGRCPVCGGQCWTSTAPQIHVFDQYFQSKQERRWKCNAWPWLVADLRPNLPMQGDHPIKSEVEKRQSTWEWHTSMVCNLAPQAALPTIDARLGPVSYTTYNDTISQLFIVTERGFPLYSSSN